MASRVGLPLPSERYLNSEEQSLIFGAISLDYFLDSILSLTSSSSRPIRINIRKDDSSSLMVYRPDGSFKDESFRLSKDPEVVSAESALAAVKWGPLFANVFEELDPFYISMFDSLIKYLKSQNIQPVLVALPIHPEYRKRLSYWKSWPTILRSEQFFIDYAKKNDVLFLGGWSTDDVGCGLDEFIDANHPKESCYVKILHPLARRFP